MPLRVVASVVGLNGPVSLLFEVVFYPFRGLKIEIVFKERAVLWEVGDKHWLATCLGDPV